MRSRLPESPLKHSSSQTITTIKTNKNRNHHVITRCFCCDGCLATTTPVSCFHRHLPKKRFRRRFIFQLLGVLILSGLLMTLILMIQLETSYNNHHLLDAVTSEITIFADEQNDEVGLRFPHSLSSSSSSSFSSPEKKQATTTGGTAIQTSTTNTSFLFQPLPPFLEYLGVLLDAGRHYFPLEWMYETLLPQLHVMDYNYLHLRLTDDQNFVVNLTITTLKQKKNVSMAFNAAAVNSNGVYQPHELQHFVRYAKAKYNIIVIPELNIPGHAGSWGYSSPGLIVQCPNYVCMKGYGIPLNIRHSELPNILRQILTQIVDIFDHPPYLHLGGDELHLSRPCLEEEADGMRHSPTTTTAITSTSPADSTFNMTKWLLYDIPYFERHILQPIIYDLGYNSNQIVRWEATGNKRAKKKMTNHKQQPAEEENNGHDNTPLLYRRFGSITHYWETTPKPSSSETSVNPYIASSGLYLDVLTSNRLYGYGDFLAARALATKENPPFAIVAGTFELSVDLWKDRNVWGRLLAIRMGVSSPPLLYASLEEEKDQAKNNEAAVQTAISQQDFRSEYISKCMIVFSNQITEKNRMQLCQQAGWPLLQDRLYQVKWKNVWKEWKNGLCEGLTYDAKITNIQPSTVEAKSQRRANVKYWNNLLNPSTASIAILPPQKRDYNRTKQILSSVLVAPMVTNIGIRLDLVQDPLSQRDFWEFLHAIQPLGFNILQLNLADDFGQVVDYKSIPNIGYSPYNGGLPYRRHHLEHMVEWAKQGGIHVLPEINLATRGGGFYKAGILMNCPQTLCQKGQGIAFDVFNNLEGVLPIIVAAILELQQIFSPSSSLLSSNITHFIHLGSDERRAASKGCFMEAGHEPLDSLAALHRFEVKLSVALSMMGIEPGQIIRWNNDERIHYPNRTGSITHYTTEKDFNVKDGSNDSPYFGTVILTDDMSEWDVFQATRLWIGESSTPLGLIAMRSGGGIPRLSQMVAYALGSSNIGTIQTSQDDFQKHLDDICAQVACSGRDSFFATRTPPKKNSSVDLIEACLERTINITVKRSKLLEP